MDGGIVLFSLLLYVLICIEKRHHFEQKKKRQAESLSCGGTGIVISFRSTSFMFLLEMVPFLEFCYDTHENNTMKIIIDTFPTNCHCFIDKMVHLLLLKSSLVYKVLQLL